MKETYYLNQKEVPTIPVPHDCVIKEIKIETDSLSLIFEDDISRRDVINNIKPDAKSLKSLIVKYHLIQDIYDLNMFVRSKANRILHKSGVFKEVDLIKKGNALKNLTKNNLAYLYHNVGYCSIIVKLWSSSDIILDITADYVEFEWVE